MKIIIHQNSKTLVKVISSDSEEIVCTSKTCTGAFWELAERFPDEVVGWCEEKLEHDLEMEHWEKIFHHELIMASFAAKTNYLPPALGYVDQLPFININRQVSYGTWRMTADVGGVRGEVILKFNQLLKKEKNFNYLLNSIAKLGQQNGLFCLSEPGLIRKPKEDAPQSTAGKAETFRFVLQHYTTAWTSVLFLCFILYERSFPLLPYIKSFFSPKLFRQTLALAAPVSSCLEEKPSERMDVIIPTMGRANYLYELFKDFATQTQLPKKLIIVEQNPVRNSVSDLDFIKNEKWPFEVVHIFTHRTGACNARNLALDEVTAEWVFFADDDLRLEEDLIKNIFTEIKKYHLCAVNMNCKQPGEKTVFRKMKQWGSFGSGTSVVRSDYAKRCKFSSIFEFGHGEDADYGMQLRQIGCDIIYHPQLEILHLKAPIGGLRQKPVLEWEKEHPLPKPSPTVMAYALRNYTLEQIMGYKISLFLKFYPQQKITNPVSYVREMNERWKKSRVWAEELIQKDRATH